jgi:hypothetical protein
MKGAAVFPAAREKLDAQKRPCRGDTAAAGGEQICVALGHNGADIGPPPCPVKHRDRSATTTGHCNWQSAA